MQKKKLYLKFCARTYYALGGVKFRRNFALREIMHWEDLCNEKNYIWEKFYFKEVTN